MTAERKPWPAEERAAARARCEAYDREDEERRPSDRNGPARRIFEVFVRTDLPRALDEIDRLEAERDALKAHEIKLEKALLQVGAERDDIGLRAISAEQERDALRARVAELEKPRTCPHCFRDSDEKTFATDSPEPVLHVEKVMAERAEYLANATEANRKCVIALEDAIIARHELAEMTRALADRDAQLKKAWIELGSLRLQALRGTDKMSCARCGHKHHQHGHDSEFGYICEDNCSCQGFVEPPNALELCSRPEGWNGKK